MQNWRSSISESLVFPFIYIIRKWMILSKIIPMTTWTFRLIGAHGRRRCSGSAHGLSEHQGRPITIFIYIVMILQMFFHLTKYELAFHGQDELGVGEYRLNERQFHRSYTIGRKHDPPSKAASNYRMYNRVSEEVEWRVKGETEKLTEIGAKVIITFSNHQWILDFFQ